MLAQGPPKAAQLVTRLGQADDSLASACTALQQHGTRHTPKHVKHALCAHNVKVRDHLMIEYLPLAYATA